MKQYPPKNRITKGLYEKKPSTLRFIVDIPTVGNRWVVMVERKLSASRKDLRIRLEVFSQQFLTSLPYFTTTFFVQIAMKD